MPFFKLSEAIPVTKPTRVGPPEQPTSPANASSANIAVAPFRSAADGISLTDIAANTGYDNTNYFCRLFKKYVGMSPAQYRSRKNLH